MDGWMAGQCGTRLAVGLRRGVAGGDDGGPGVSYPWMGPGGPVPHAGVRVRPLGRSAGSWAARVNVVRPERRPVDRSLSPPASKLR